MALEISKVANKVSNVLNIPVTVDQVVQISQILNGEKSVGSVATKTKTKTSHVTKVNEGIRLNWNDWVNWDKVVYDGAIQVFSYGNDLPRPSGMSFSNLHQRFTQSAIKNARARGLKVSVKRLGRNEVRLSFFKA
jgi:hypothetical protein